MGCLTANNVVGTNIVEPASIVLTSVNVKLHGNLFARLNVELFDTILTKDVEQHLARILSGYFNYILLCHPGIACAG